MVGKFCLKWDLEIRVPAVYFSSCKGRMKWKEEDRRAVKEDWCRSGEGGDAPAAEEPLEKLSVKWAQCSRNSKEPLQTPGPELLWFQLR